MRRVLTIVTVLLYTLCVNAQIEEPRRLLEIGVAGGMSINNMEFQPSIRQLTPD